MGQPPTAEGKVTQDADGTIWIEPEKYEPIIDMYRRLNQPEGRRADHQEYLRMARVGLGDQYPGANWVGHLWYTRNLKIFVNLTRITESADDRILLIIGAGHVFSSSSSLKIQEITSSKVRCNTWRQVRRKHLNLLSSC